LNWIQAVMMHDQILFKETVCGLKWRIGLTLNKSFDLGEWSHCKASMDQLCDMQFIIKLVLISIGAWCSIRNTLSIISRRAARTKRKTEDWNTCMHAWLIISIVLCSRIRWSEVWEDVYTKSVKDSCAVYEGELEIS